MLKAMPVECNFLGCVALSAALAGLRRSLELGFRVWTWSTPSWWG